MPERDEARRRPIAAVAAALRYAYPLLLVLVAWELVARAGLIRPLFLPPVIAKPAMTIEHIYDLFPNLKERGASRGTSLSGGEQQMLAIARILRTGANVLLLDEPTEGLAPVIVQQIARTIREIKERGLTVLLVEQNARFVEELADVHYLIENGAIVDRMEAAEFSKSIAKVNKLLGV